MENGTVKAREMVHTKNKVIMNSSHSKTKTPNESHEKLIMESSKKNDTHDSNPMLTQDTGDSYTVVVTNKTVERLSDPEVATRVKVVRSVARLQCSRNTCSAYLAIAATSIVFLLIIIIVQPSLFCLSCSGSNSSESVCLTPECVQTAASLLAAMDRTADPCHDFFQFACGSWNKEHTIPEDKSSTSTFEVLADKLQKILKGLLEAEKTDQDNNVTMMAKDMYSSCKNLTMIMNIGDQPLRDAIGQFGGWPVLDPDWEPPESLEKVLAGIRILFNVDILIALWVGPDDRNSEDNIIQIDQTQLGLPSRDYFLQPRSKRDLDAYHRYMTRVAILLGANATDAQDQLWEVILFEQQLANISVAEDDRQDTGRIYTKVTIDQLSSSVPEINWLTFFDNAIPIKINGTEQLVSYSMPFFQHLGVIIQLTDKKVLYNYIIWRLVMSAMPFLPPTYQEPRTEFRRVLLGVLKERERWVSCVEWTNKKMGMSVGSMFIKDHFNQESKQIALEMIHDLREAFNELLDENHWMDAETRLVAKDKANSMNERIGYPEYIMNVSSLVLDYKNLNISPHRFLENIFSFERLKAAKNFAKLRNPVSKDRWSTEPAVVNAFYNPNKNDIVFPAGILQPLFYSKDFPKSLNYGGIGVVIGHEITHGFDDKGRQFDKHGNLKQWWNNATIQRFRTQAKCMVDQYSRYKLDQIDLHINGRMTQGENIADNGGLKQAYRAYRKWVQIHGAEVPLPGLCLTHDQVFFLNYAQIWCGSMRPEDALTRVRSAVHSPGPIRVIGPLSNSVEFAAAYQCKPGTRMNPTQKCSVW